MQVLIDLGSLVKSRDCISLRAKLVSSQGHCSEMLSTGQGASVVTFCRMGGKGGRGGRRGRMKGDWHICTGIGTEAGREMVEVISETALIPGAGSEQHPPLIPSLYSQISVCL